MIVSLSHICHTLQFAFLTVQILHNIDNIFAIQLKVIPFTNWQCYKNNHLILQLSRQKCCVCITCAYSSNLSVASGSLFHSRSSHNSSRTGSMSSYRGRAPALMIPISMPFWKAKISSDLRNTISLRHWTLFDQIAEKQLDFFFLKINVCLKMNIHGKFIERNLFVDFWSSLFL